MRSPGIQKNLLPVLVGHQSRRWHLFIDSNATVFEKFAEGGWSLTGGLT